ncbi:MAG: hypothetical protein C0617_07450, partial [Desulfuromonas sp.]|uniref:PAS domain-containing protein n=1 Tax=Desulfuromonas sp. TaxID=892 RepID=UPI000CC450D5
MSLLVRARYRRVFALLLLGAWIALCFPGPAAAAGEPKKVLILHSYHHGFPWTEGIMAGMQKVFSEAGDPPQLHVEYLDAKRYHDTEYLDHVLEGVFDHKLAGRRFDLVLLYDNDAFNYVLKHRHDLFAGTPIVFCGVNGYRPADPAAGGMTGVDDSPSFAETIELALRLHPGAEEFVFIGSTDNVPGRLFRRALEALAPRFPVRFQFWDDLPAEEIEERLGRLPANRLISIYGFVRDRSGRILPFAESCRRIREASSAPLYGFWDFFLGQGAVGGKVVSSERQGRLAAGLALRVLAGEDPDAIPVIRSGANVYMFDYPELQRFGISPESLPPGSLVLNRPPPFYSVNKEYLWAGLGIMTGLLGLSLALAWTLRLHRQVEQKLRDNARLVQTLLDAIPLSVYYMDVQGRYLGCNSASEEFIGRSRDEVIGRTSEDLFPPDMAEQYRTADAELFRTRQIQIVENKFVGADGRDRDLQFHKAPFFDSRGNVEGLVGTILDITERKQAEQEIESLARFPQENNN